jgi:hypothetical protein
METLMTPPSVDAPSPPTQAPNLIYSWEDGMRLEDRGDGQAAVTMMIEGERRDVALVEYGETAATSTPRWNRTAALTPALPRSRRDALDTKIYMHIALWLRGPS